MRVKFASTTSVFEERVCAIFCADKHDRVTILM
jgi:hypothetical protein